MNKAHSPLILPLSLLMAILAVSTASIFIRFAQKEAPSVVIAALRLAIASLTLAPMALTRSRVELHTLTRRDLLLGLLSGIFLSIHFATWITSLEYTTIASSVVLVSTGPLWVTLLSPWILREQPSRSVLLGMVLALIGVTIIGLSDACRWQNALICTSPSQLLKGRAMLGNSLALIGAVAIAGYLMVGRKLRAKMSLLPYIFLAYSTAAICLIMLMLVAGLTPLGYQPMTYAWIVLLALIPQLIGHSAYNWALAHLPASFVSIATLGEPIGSAILAYFILREIPTLGILSGGILILMGIFLASGRTSSPA